MLHNRFLPLLYVHCTAIVSILDSNVAGQWSTHTNMDNLQNVDFLSCIFAIDYPENCRSSHFLNILKTFKFILTIHFQFITEQHFHIYLLTYTSSKSSIRSKECRISTSCSCLRPDIQKKRRKCLPRLFQDLIQ